MQAVTRSAGNALFFAVSKGVSSISRNEASAFLEDELKLLDRAMRVKVDRIKSFGESERMKARPKSACKKVRYRSRKDALKALQRVKAHRERQMEFGWQFAKIETRVYRCPTCSHGYHLSSRPLKGPRVPGKVLHLRKAITREELVTVVANVA